MTLRELEIGSTARILEVNGEGALRQHLLDMGLIPGADVTVVKYAPMGDPIEVRIHGYELTLRLADAGQITVEKKKAEKTDGAEERQGGSEKPRKKKVAVQVQLKTTGGHFLPSGKSLEISRDLMSTRPSSRNGTTA